MQETHKSNKSANKLEIIDKNIKIYTINFDKSFDIIIKFKQF